MTNVRIHPVLYRPITGALRIALSFCCFLNFGLAAETPQRGQADARLQSFDELMLSFVHDSHIPGAALAIAKDGRLIFARSYGWADEAAGKPVLPDSLFRIASLSKPITAAGILRLVQEKRLQLDDLAIPHLPSTLLPVADTPFDKRISKITIRHLLNHTAGFDRTQSFDPMFRAREIQDALNLPDLPAASDIIRYVLARELDFDPGSKYAYSNIGYNILGRIIEQTTTMPYESYIQSAIFEPMKISRMRLGMTNRSHRTDHEVTYSDFRPKRASVFAPSDDPPFVSRPYGAWHLEPMDAHGGWLGSAVDLVRFAEALFSNHLSPLGPESRSLIESRPAPPVATDSEGEPLNVYYGFGWSIRVQPNKGINFWHNGLLDGTASILVKRSDGLTWAALFNSRSGTGPARRNLASAIDPLLHQAAANVKEWPRQKDLFPLYLGAVE